MFQVVYTDPITGVTENIEIPGIRKPRPAGASSDTEWTYIATNAASLNSFFMEHPRSTIEKQVRLNKKSVVDCQADINSHLRMIVVYDLLLPSIRDTELKAECTTERENLQAQLARYEADLVYYKGATSAFEALLARRQREDLAIFSIRLTAMIHLEMQRLTEEASEPEAAPAASEPEAASDADGAGSLKRANSDAEDGSAAKRAKADV